ncbi:MAG: SDR family NAD(P)-dependent oxidoreductase [Bacteroidia bacterium]|nr:SDR family NAD(P)-dependent oxidoreductase [Bacteroidia bacterium]
MTFSAKEKDRLKATYGPWALLTGASSGIGMELAERLAEAGLNLVMVARRKHILEDLKSRWQQTYGVKILCIEADLAREDDLQRIYAETSQLDLGLFVAAAGFGSGGNFLETEIKNEVNMIEINCSAVLKMTHHYGKVFSEEKRGGIILFSSLLAFQGTPYSANYAATKAYIQSLAEGIRIELAPFGVDVLSAAPGPVHSGFAAEADMKMNAALTPGQVGIPILKALGRRGTVFPAFLTKFLTGSLSIMPRWAKVRVMKLIMGGMTAHQMEEKMVSSV